MQGLFIYVRIYFVRYSMNAVNADSECRLWNDTNKAIPSLSKRMKKTKCVFFCWLRQFVLAPSVFNLFLYLYNARAFMFHQCLKSHFMLGVVVILQWSRWSLGSLSNSLTFER